MPVSYTHLDVYKRQDVIRINSQSGKGGIGYLLEHHYGINLPKKMREEFGYRVKSISEQQSRELSVEELHRIFKDTYLNLSAPICLEDFYFVHKDIYRLSLIHISNTAWWKDLIMSRCAHRTAWANGLSWRAKSCLHAPSATRTTIWTAWSLKTGCPAC